MNCADMFLAQTVDSEPGCCFGAAKVAARFLSVPQHPAKNLQEVVLLPEFCSQNAPEHQRREPDLLRS